MTYPQYPYQPYQPYRPPKKNHTAAIVIGLVVGIPVMLIVMFVGMIFMLGVIGMSVPNDTGPTKLPSGNSPTPTTGTTTGSTDDDDTSLFDDAGKNSGKDDAKAIGECGDTEGYKNYASTALSMYDKYNALVQNGTILQVAGLPKTQDSVNYVHDFMVILTDYKSSTYFGCYTQSTSLDEVNDKYDAKAQEIKDYEKKFLAHQNLGVTIKITNKDGSTYESDGKAPEGADVDDLESKIKAVPLKPGADGTWLDTGDQIIKAAGLTANYDYQQIGQYCRRSFGDTSTVQAAYCSASPTVIYINENHPGFNQSIKSSYFVDIMKHELAHALIDRACGTTDPAVGANAEALANSYAVKYLGADRKNLQDNIKDYPEYTITAASDKGADAVHNGQCAA